MDPAGFKEFRCFGAQDFKASGAEFKNSIFCVSCTLCIIYAMYEDGTFNSKRQAACSNRRVAVVLVESCFETPSFGEAADIMALQRCDPPFLIPGKSVTQSSDPD